MESLANMENSKNENGEMIDSVKDYYGKVLDTNKDLKTSACCSTETLPNYVKEVLCDIHDEVLVKFYGCGSPIPQPLTGLKVLDLGSGSGRDCFILSKLVGPSGFVTGIDMTDEQLEVARKHLPYHMKKFGLEQPNTEFVSGYMEDLAAVGVKSESMDLVVSNCVLNLSPNKELVFQEIFRALKPGGELYFSDVFATRRIPEDIATDPVMVGECLGGAMYIEDFRRVLAKFNIFDYRIVSQRTLTVNDSKLKDQLEGIEFLSLTIRVFKLPLEDQCEDFGQVAIYNGGVPHSNGRFALDDSHTFEQGRAVPVCGNTADMLSQTRFKEYFTVVGDKSKHFGLFDCGPVSVQPQSSEIGSEVIAGGCC